MMRVEVECPGCRCVVVAVDGRYGTHHPEGGPKYCFMSGMPQPVSGMSEQALRERARIVACLAQEVQDSDPHAVWHYLGVMPHEFVKELLQVALAAIDVEGKRVKDIWAEWGVE